VDAAAVVVWATFLVVAFDTLGGRRRLFYALLAGGVVAYTLAREPLAAPDDD